MLNIDYAKVAAQAQQSQRLIEVLASVLDKFARKNMDGEYRWQITSYPQHVLKYIKEEMENHQLPTPTKEEGK